MSWQWASRRSVARSSGGFTRMSSRISWMFTCLPLSLRAVVVAVWVIIHAKRRQRNSLGGPAAPGQAAPGPGAGLVVRDVAVRPVVVPLRRPLATRVGDFPRWPLLLIDVTTEQGITGRSYLAPYLDRAAAALLPAVRDLGAGLR